MSSNGKLKFLMGRFSKKSPAHVGYYPREYKGRPDPGGYYLMEPHK